MITNIILATNIVEYKLYTEAEIAYIRQESYDKGTRLGHAKGYEEGYEEGYHNGWETGFDSGSTPIGLTPEGE